MDLRSTSCAVLIAALACACGATDELEDAQFRGRQGAIVYGQPDIEPAHSAVVALFMGHEGLCSGTLIARDVVLTAAHCVADVASPDRVYVGFGTRIDGGMDWIRASETLVHPSYDPEWPAYDIALVRLSKPAPADVIPIPPLPSSLEITSADVGSELQFSGFGQTETGDSGDLLQVAGQLGSVCESTSGCLWRNSVMAPMTLCFNQKPGGPCSGDSGGPAFVVRDGVEYVAGVTSYGDETCQLLGCSVKVDAFEDFITPFMGGRNGIACTTADDCGSGHCVEGVCCNTACEGTCVTCEFPDREGACTSLPDGVACNDSDQCTLADTCQDAVCTPTEFVGCPAPTECRPAVACDPSSGVCEGPPAADGTKCAQGICESGECVPEGCGCAGFGAQASVVWALALLLMRRRSFTAAR